MSARLLAVAAAAAAAAADWSQGDVGMDNMNNDLMSFNLTTNTTAECATACSNFSGCIGWVMAPSGSCGAQPFCWLKSMMAAVTPNPCRISGILPAAVLPKAYSSLPVGSVQPTGWLMTQLELQATGLAGFLFYFWPDIQQSIWLGGSGDGGLHERGPYFLNGMVPLAYQTGNANVTAQITTYIDHILASQAPSGWLGPDDMPNDGDEYWSRFNVIQSMLQYWEATNDPRIMPALFGYLMEARRRMLDVTPLSDWAVVRAQDFILSLHYLIDNFDAIAAQLPPASLAYYNQAFLYDLATITNAQMVTGGGDWKSWFDGPEFPTGVTCNPEPCSLLTHGVNNGQAIKSSAVWWRQSQDGTDVDSTYIRMQKLDKYHGAPSGIFQSDEHLAGTMPSHGTELCTVVEIMYSYEVAGDIIGDPAFYERAEQVAYNALPATLTKDMWAHQYLQQANEINAMHTDPHVWVTDGPDSTIYGLEPNYGCCTANHPQGWPKFVQRMIKSLPGGAGIAVAMWGPVNAQVPVSGGSASISVATTYPFGDSAVVTATVPTAGLTLQLRVPSWATAATLQTGTGPAVAIGSAAGSFYNVTLAVGTSTFTVAFNPTIRVEPWLTSSVVVRRGALLYALQMGQNITQLAYYAFNSTDLQVLPTSAWNYALYLPDASNPASSLSFKQLGVPGSEPYSTSDVPVVITGQGRRVLGWTAETNAAAPPPASPACADAGACGPLEPITLVPFGSSLLRMSVLPYTTS